MKKTLYDNDPVKFPWIGNDCVEIMADAAMCVLKGMTDGEKYMKTRGILVD